MGHAHPPDSIRGQRRLVSTVYPSPTLISVADDDKPLGGCVVQIWLRYRRGSGASSYCSSQVFIRLTSASYNVTRPFPAGMVKRKKPPFARRVQMTAMV